MSILNLYRFVGNKMSEYEFYSRDINRRESGVGVNKEFVGVSRRRDVGVLKSIIIIEEMFLVGLGLKVKLYYSVGFDVSRNLINVKSMFYL